MCVCVYIYIYIYTHTQTCILVISCTVALNYQNDDFVGMRNSGRRKMFVVVGQHNVTSHPPHPPHPPPSSFHLLVTSSTSSTCPQQADILPLPEHRVMHTVANPQQPGHGASHKGSAYSTVIRPSQSGRVQITAQVCTHTHTYHKSFCLVCFGLNLGVGAL